MYAASAAWLASALGGLVLGLGLVVTLPAAVVVLAAAGVGLGAVTVAVGSAVAARRLGEPLGSALRESLREGASWLLFFIP